MKIMNVLSALLLLILFELSSLVNSCWGILVRGFSFFFFFFGLLVESKLQKTRYFHSFDKIYYGNKLFVDQIDLTIH